MDYNIRLKSWHFVRVVK